MLAAGGRFSGSKQKESRNKKTQERNSIVAFAGVNQRERSLKNGSGLRQSTFSVLEGRKQERGPKMRVKFKSGGQGGLGANRRGGLAGGVGR